MNKIKINLRGIKTINATIKTPNDLNFYKSESIANRFIIQNESSLKESSNKLKQLFKFYWGGIKQIFKNSNEAKIMLKKSELTRRELQFVFSFIM